MKTPSTSSSLRQLKRRLLEPHAGSRFLMRAVGLPPVNRKVLDATGGLGRDSFSLALVGFEVLTCERNAVIFQKLSETYQWLISEGEPFSTAFQRMKIFHRDSIEVLESDSFSIDIVIIDPLLKRSERSAKRKKEMEWIHDHANEDTDANQLLELALQKANDRVVVKRPFGTPPIASPVTHSWKTKAHRWDMYRCKG